MRRRSIGLLVLSLILGSAALAFPQPAADPAPDPSDPFFDDTVLHEIRLAIHTKDWETLKANYREYQQIGAAALADPEKPYTNDQFIAAVEAMRGFARERDDFVRAEVEKVRPSTP